jgi:hypothetical protein
MGKRQETKAEDGRQKQKTESEDSRQVRGP